MVWVQAHWFSWRSHKERSHIWKWWGSDRRAMNDHCIPFTPLSCVLHVTHTHVSMQCQFRWCCVSVLSFFFFCLAGFDSNSVFTQCGFTLDTIQPCVWSTGEKAAAAELLLSPALLLWSSSDWLTPWLTYLSFVFFSFFIIELSSWLCSHQILRYSIGNSVTTMSASVCSSATCWGVLFQPGVETRWRHSKAEELKNK